MDLMMVASRSVDDLYPAVETHLGWEGCLILVAMFDMVPHSICNDPFPKHLIILHHFVSVQLRNILPFRQFFGRLGFIPPRLQLPPQFLRVGSVFSLQLPGTTLLGF
jgi:hypothetical protein